MVEGVKSLDLPLNKSILIGPFNGFGKRGNDQVFDW